MIQQLDVEWFCNLIFVSFNDILHRLLRIVLAKYWVIRNPSQDRYVTRQLILSKLSETMKWAKKCKAKEQSKVWSSNNLYFPTGNYMIGPWVEIILFVFYQFNFIKYKIFVYPRRSCQSVVDLTWIWDHSLSDFLTSIKILK